MKRMTHRSIDEIAEGKDLVKVGKGTIFDLGSSYAFSEINNLSIPKILADNLNIEEYQRLPSNVCRYENQFIAYVDNLLERAGMYVKIDELDSGDSREDWEHAQHIGIMFRRIRGTLYQERPNE